MPVLVFAQNIIPNNPTTLPGNEHSTITGTLGFYIQVVLGVVGLLAVVFLIYGGFRYITAGSSEEGVESAKRIIKNSIIGLVVIILAFIIVITITNALLPQGAGI